MDSFQILIYLFVTCFAEPVYKIETAQDVNEHCSESLGCPEAGSNMRCLVEAKTADCWYTRDDLMTDDFIYKYLLALLNKERALLGSDDAVDRVGEDLKLPKAKVMHLVQWDKDLADIAHRLADRCDKHVQCMKLYLKAMCATTKLFTYPRHIGNYSAKLYVYGENQAMTPERAAKEAMETIYRPWFTEGKKNTTAADMKAYPNNPNDANDIYLNLMNGETTHIGCHLAAYKTYNKDTPNNRIADLLDLQCYVSGNLTEGKPIFCMDESDKEKDSNCKCKPGYRKKNPDDAKDFLCYPESELEERNQTEPCGPVMLIMPIIKEVNAPPRKLTTTTKLPIPEPATTPRVLKYYNDSLTYNMKRKALQKYLPKSKPKPKNAISRREFSNLRRIIQDYVRKKRVSPVSRSSTGATKTQAPVKVSQRFKFDDIDRLIGAIRRANKT